MGPRGASMASALGTEAMVARPAAAREIVIVDRGDTIELEVPGGAEAMRWTLPVNAAATSVSDAQGKTMRAQAVRDGTALVIRREHQVSLPGGGEVTVEIEERHELLADSTLRVQTTSKAGAQQQVHVATYRRVK